MSEVGAIIIVGGNIEHLTRTMTTGIVLETSRGEFSFALNLIFKYAGIKPAVHALRGKKE